MRNTFIKTLTKLAESDKDIYLVIADLGFSVVEEFEKQFPDRFINTGIAEANAVSIAAGLALCGKKPFVYSIAPFITMRAFEQVRVDCAYMNTNVKLVGVGGGVAYGPAGATHHAIEDLAVMRALPNIIVTAPGDPTEAEALIKNSLTTKRPMYIRLAKNNEPVLTADKAEDIVLGKAHIYSKGNDLTILTTGSSFENGTKIVELLKKYQINAELANIHTIKPFDKEYLLERISKNIPVVTIEEHNIIGGLGSAVSEIIAESEYNVRFKRFGIPDQYSHFVGSQQFILGKWNLDVDSIAQEILKFLA